MSLYVLDELKFYLAVVGQVTTPAASSWRRMHTSGLFPGRWGPGESLRKEHVSSHASGCQMRSNLLPKQPCLAVSGPSTLLLLGIFLFCFWQVSSRQHHHPQIYPTAPKGLHTQELAVKAGQVQLRRKSKVLPTETKPVGDPVIEHSREHPERSP